MTGTVDARLAAALHKATRGSLEHDEADPAFCASIATSLRDRLADSGVVLVERSVVDAARDIAGRDDFDVRDYEQGLCFFCGAGHEPEPGPRGGVKGNRHLRPVHEPSCAYVALRAALRESR